MMKMQQARPCPRLYTGLLGCVTVLCALFAVTGAVAEGAAPTPLRPVHSHHTAQEPVRHGRDKSYAVTPRGRKLAVQDSAKADSRKSATKPEKAGTRPKGGAESSAAPKSKASPQPRTRRKKHLEEEDDGPAMYKVKAGRRGHGPVLMRVHGRLVARAPINDPARYVVGPAPLRGSRDILVHQNLMADDEGLERIQDEDDLDRLRSSHDLVDLDDSRTLHVNPELPWNRRCARAWTVKFVQDLAAAYYAKFAQPLQITSAARSVEYQLRLAHSNGNAAGIEGEVASPHLTGQAVDLGKRGMTRAQLAWMRSRLLPYIESGSIDVEEEFRQACFHISVYRSYLPVTRALPRHELAQLGSQSATPTVVKSPTMRIPPVSTSRDPDPQP